MVGPDVVLDQAQQFVISHYWDLRRQVPSDRGIPIPEGCDWVLARHLRALDDEFGNHQRRQHEKLTRDVSQGAKYPQPPPNRTVRRH